ncbi:lipopolysaccharide transport system permease protein [Rhodopirellula rubra]|uniref:Transport permease protein n=1 Tax=Aporhodopirellula rubra TaxID=980271 RepID=A0A7W5H3N4_9BACT|nr:ABC transporter permease [Aporhodopirellula rubra]MBB3204278.1 lipopolysaccharide transport system permease protein [Aporhodopirellula rubra]
MQSTEENNEWDLTISADRTNLRFNFEYFWRYRDLLLLLVHRDVVAFYKQTILGPLWFVIQPICTTIIFTIVFGQIANLSTDGLPQIAFYLCGITLWNYFSECFNKTATTFRDNAPLFGKVFFPRLIVPLSVVISNLFRFAIQFVLFASVWIYYLLRNEVQPHASILYFPIVVLTMANLGLAGGLLFSAMTIRYRDLVLFLQFGVQLLLYATPVIYPASQIPSRWKLLLCWNPLTPLFEVTRHGFLGVGEYSVLSIGYAVAFSLVALGCSAIIFNRVERTFMDSI